MKSILFQVKVDFSFESAMKEAEKTGLQDIFIIEDVVTEDKWIGGQIEKIPNKESLISLLLCGPNEISWNYQWEAFAENFQNGLAHIDLSRFGYDKILYLFPGEGFGDLSHATTYLMMDLIKDKIIEENIIDIGAGSGILTLSSKLMGAKSALGIEIDSAALRHAEKNALKNALDVNFTMHLDKRRIKKSSIFLMNMTLFEQVEFIEKHLDINDYAKSFITSGILKEQKDQYLEKISQWGWKLIEMRAKDKWLGFIFSLN